MELDPALDSLDCSACGDEIDDVGYLPAIEREDVYEPKSESAVCGTCGFNEIGMMGCAPELDEITEPGPDDVLLFVRHTAGGFEVVSVKP